MLEVLPPVWYDPCKFLALLQVLVCLLLSLLVPRKKATEQVLGHHQRVVYLLGLLHLDDRFRIQLLCQVSLVVRSVEETEQDQEAVEVLWLLHLVVSQSESEPEVDVLLGHRARLSSLILEQLLQKVLVDVGDDLAHVAGCDALGVPFLQVLSPLLKSRDALVCVPQVDEFLGARALQFMASELEQSLESIDINGLTTLTLLLIELLKLL